MPLVSLGDLTPEQFLKDYWQKKPLLIRQAIPGFRSPLSSDELAGLACEPEVESRLLLEKDGDHPWHLQHGPFGEDEFQDLPETHWTLLVQEVNRHVPALADLMDRFRFVPDWRVDDVMISYAAPQGTVGPHIDSYDVFLLQGMGKRRWEIGEKLVDPEHLPDLDVRILKEFHPTESWIVEPGDLLYLPPGVPHHGVALDPSMTLSIGFLAPSRLELQKSWVEYALCATHGDRRYEDPDLTRPEHPGEISAQALDRIAEMLASAPLDRTMMGNWFGRFITMGKPGPQVEPAEPEWELSEWRETLRDLGGIRRSEVVRFAWLGERLFVNGEAFEIPAGAGAVLTAARVLSAESLRPWLDKPGFAELLRDLTNQGYLYFEDEDEE